MLHLARRAQVQMRTIRRKSVVTNRAQDNIRQLTEGCLTGVHSDEARSLSDEPRSRSGKEGARKEKDVPP